MRQGDIVHPEIEVHATEGLEYIEAGVYAPPMAVDMVDILAQLSLVDHRRYLGPTRLHVPIAAMNRTGRRASENRGHDNTCTV